MGPSFVSLLLVLFPGHHRTVKKSFQRVRIGQQLSPNLSSHCCLSYQNVLTQCPFSPFSALQSPWTLDTVHWLLCSPLRTFHLSWSPQLPQISSNVSCKKLLVLLLTWGFSATDSSQPLLRTSGKIPNPFHLGSVWVFPMHGREELRDHHCGTFLRHLSDSETHFYLFTVNSYRRSQQSGHVYQQCLLLASPLGFQDRLPRNCLSLPPVLPCPVPSVQIHFGLSLGTVQVQDLDFCFSPGQYSLFEVKAFRFSSLALVWKRCGMNKHVLI